MFLGPVRSLIAQTSGLFDQRDSFVVQIEGEGARMALHMDAECVVKPDGTRHNGIGGLVLVTASPSFPAPVAVAISDRSLVPVKSCLHFRNENAASG